MIAVNHATFFFRNPDLHHGLPFALRTLATTLRDSERTLILRTLEAVGWVIGGPKGAAAKLGLKRTTLIHKMQKLGISRPSHQHQDMAEPPIGEPLSRVQ